MGREPGEGRPGREREAGSARAGVPSERAGPLARWCGGAHTQVLGGWLQKACCRERASRASRSPRETLQRAPGNEKQAPLPALRSPFASETRNLCFFAAAVGYGRFGGKGPLVGQSETRCSQTFASHWNIGDVLFIKRARIFFLKWLTRVDQLKWVFWEFGPIFSHKTSRKRSRQALSLKKIARIGAT